MKFWGKFGSRKEQGSAGCSVILIQMSSSIHGSPSHVSLRMGLEERGYPNLGYDSPVWVICWRLYVLWWRSILDLGSQTSVLLLETTYREMRLSTCWKSDAHESTLNKSVFYYKRIFSRVFSPSYMVALTGSCHLAKWNVYLLKSWIRAAHESKLEVFSMCWRVFFPIWLHWQVNKLKLGLV